PLARPHEDDGPRAVIGDVPRNLARYVDFPSIPVNRKGGNRRIARRGRKSNCHVSVSLLCRAAGGNWTWTRKRRPSRSACLKSPCQRHLPPQSSKIPLGSDIDPKVSSMISSSGVFWRGSCGPPVPAGVSLAAGSWASSTWLSACGAWCVASSGSLRVLSCEYATYIAFGNVAVLLSSPKTLLISSSKSSGQRPSGASAYCLR